MSQATQYHVFETAMGFCAIAWSEAGIARFQLPVKSAEAAERLMRRRALDAEPQAPSGRSRGGRRGGETVLRRRGNGLLAGPARPRRPGPILRPDLRRLAPGRLGPHDHLWRAGEGGWRWPRSGARCRRGDGQESGAVDRSLSPGPGRRRQDRRFLGARRLENQGSDAGAGRRSDWAAGSRATIFQFLSRAVALAEPPCQAAHSA